MNALNQLSPSVVPYLLAPVTSAFKVSEAQFVQFVRKAELALKSVDAASIYVEGPLLAGGWEPGLAD